MARLLDRSQEDEVKDIVMGALDETGYHDAAENIPGLIAAIKASAAELGRGEEQALDEAANLLAD